MSLVENLENETWHRTRRTWEPQALRTAFETPAVSSAPTYEGQYLCCIVIFEFEQSTCPIMAARQALQNFPERLVKTRRENDAKANVTKIGCMVLKHDRDYDTGTQEDMMNRYERKEANIFIEYSQTALPSLQTPDPRHLH
ncbi:hypothetical protein G7K_2598-t1 [Saitoella complicata NRRL Y-17804]|uniref:Uncharacterized protein n=1 Tax=Saitoella complicata (strain BCRC 22490 / CBS 7301 / JCM 7358 / NBRC 10748 / NRRL Y-17804) TaxID=698492 RepID=A0A0E9NGA3_SAICN|nr:hypothetical protein G7K_2598-t1 [Saitoella complicata NRRL Y-17804]